MALWDPACLVGPSARAVLPRVSDPRAADGHPPPLRPTAFAARGAMVFWDPARERSRATHLRSGLRPSLRAALSRRPGTRRASGRAPPTSAQAYGLRCAQRYRAAGLLGPGARAVAAAQDRAAGLLGPGARAVARHPPPLRPTAFAARSAIAPRVFWDPARERSRATHLRSGLLAARGAIAPRVFWDPARERSRDLRSGLRPSLRAALSARWDPARERSRPPTSAQAYGLRCARRYRAAGLVGPGARAVARHPPPLRPTAFAARGAIAPLAGEISSAWGDPRRRGDPGRGPLRGRRGFVGVCWRRAVF